MKLGTETGSLTNHILSRAVIGQPEPEVGMGATILGWTDRHAATIIEVGKYRGMTMVTVQEDYSTRTDKNGMSECQTWSYDRNPNGRKSQFAFAKHGWREIMTNPHNLMPCLGDGYGLRIGERETYHDFSF